MSELKSKVIESGDYCQKFNTWIEDKTIQDCKAKGTYIEKGCYYCAHSSWRIIKEFKVVVKKHVIKGSVNE